MQIILKTFTTITLCAVLLLLLSETSSARLMEFETSRYEFSVDTSMVNFVNSDGIFDGTTDYVEVISYVKSKDGHLTGTAYHLIDLKNPYIKIYKIQFRDTSSKKTKENTSRINDDWVNVEKNNLTRNYQLYYEVVNFVNQNWDIVYSHSGNQDNSISISTSNHTSTTPIEETKPEEKALPNLSWDGTWKTRVGEMQLKKIGNNVECTINKHKLLGTIINDKVVGKWSGIRFLNSTESEGEFQFIMSPDGKFIKIKWKDRWVDWATDSTADRLL